MKLRLDVSGDPPDFLAKGAESVMQEYPTDPLFTPDHETLRLELASIVGDIESEMAGHTPEAPAPTRVDRLDLIRRLRRVVLRDWSDDDEGLLAAMRAFDAMDAALTTGEDAAAGSAVNAFPRSVLREVGHLLRSPLGSIVLLTETLLEERSGTLTEPQRRQLGIVYRAAVGAAASAGDLLTLTTPTEYFEDARPFTVGEMISTVADTVGPVAEVRNCRLVVHQDVEGVRRGPVIGVRQALLGLATSSALMTRDGSLEVTASVVSGDVVLFTVTATAGADAPLGAAASDPLRLFRSDGESDSYTIAPEGLAFNAARSIIRSMGSDLEVETATSESLTLGYRLGLPLA